MRKTPVVMGVLAMVFGGLQVLMTGFSLITQPFSKQMMGDMGKALSGAAHKQGQPDMAPMFDRLARLTDELKPYTYLISFAMLAFSITLILVGWLLYKRRAQSRPYAIAWAIGALIYLPVQLWVQVKVILPRTQEITRSMLEGMPNASSSVAESMTSLQGVMTVVFYLAFYTPFPILLLWLIGRESTKNDLLPATV
jgi:hypothetical protein